MMIPLMAGVEAVEPVTLGMTDLWSGRLNDTLVPDAGDTGDLPGLRQEYPLNSLAEGL